MERSKPARRRRRRPKVENLYKILGIRENATPEAIRKRYIELVKAFPPESHPEEFQRVRRAYETLHDPARRGEYDLLRKYGGQIERIMEDALALMEDERWEKAAALLRKALRISPRDFRVRLGLGMAALSLGDDRAFREEFQAALELAPDNLKIGVLAKQAELLLDEERPGEALAVLDQARTLYPEQGRLLDWLYVDAYRELERHQELWALVQSMLPAPEEQAAEHISVFILYLNILIDLERWSDWSHIQARIRKFLKSITGEEDRLMIVALLKDEHDEWIEAGFYRAAEMFIDLAYYIDSKNQQLQRQRRETQDMMHIEKEIQRINRDQDILPLVFIHAFEWFYEDCYPPELLHSIRDGIAPELMSEMLGMSEEIGESIVRLRKRYPLTYRRFQGRWEALFQEHIGHLNREARRRLR